MRVLLYNWGFSKIDIREALGNMGVSYDLFGYGFADKNKDEFFEHRFTKMLKSVKYDAVFSINFFPMIAKCCHKQGIKYISWSYDNPLNVTNIEDSLGLSTNYVFFFDRIQAQKYADMGFECIYHLPLAVNTNRLDRITLTKTDIDRYASDVSFVGRLYDSDFNRIYSLLSEYHKGYLDSIIKVQGSLYGCYLMDEAVSEQMMLEINKSLMERQIDLTISKEALLYAMAAQITREERLLILALLKSHFRVKLYSREWNDMLKGVEFCGSCNYLKEMPKIFRASKVNLNISLKMIQSGIPLRCLDVMGAGGFLLSNYQPELLEFFEPGKEFAMYESVEDSYEKAAYYLTHEDERKAIAIAGYEKAKKEFSYENRLERIFRETKLI